MQQDAVRLEQAEVLFRRDIWSVAPEDAVTEAGVQMRWFGPVFASVFADLPRAGSLNLIQGAAQPGAVADGYLEAAIEWVSSWEVDFVVPVASDRPGTELAEQWLEWHGYEQGIVVRRFARHGTGPRHDPVPGVEVRGLPPHEDELIGCLATEGLGLPDLAVILFIGLPCLENWRCYVALLEGDVAATGSMMINDGVATLGLDATLSFARGRGCQRALLERRLADAAGTGCHTIQAFACDSIDPAHSPPSANLRRAGFEEVGRIVTWQLPVATDD